MEKIKEKFYITMLLIAGVAYLFLKESSLPILILCNVIILGVFLYKKLKADIFDLKVLFLVNYSVYILYTPLKLLNPNYNGEDWYYLSSDRLLASKIVFICGIIAVISFIMGEVVYSKFNICKKGNIKNNKYYKKFTNIFNFIKNYKIINIKTFSYFLVFSGIIFFCIGIIKQGGIEYLLSKYIWNSDKIVEVGIMTTGIYIAFVGISISFYELLNQKEFKLVDIFKWPLLYIYIFLVSVKFLQGGRIQVLMSFISMISIYHYTYKRISLKNAAIIAFLGVITMGYVGYFRDYKTIVPEDFKTLLKYMAGGSGGLEYFLNSYTIFTTMSVIGAINISYLYGATLLDGLIFLIPRVFIPNKEAILFTNKKLAELSSIEIISPVGGLNLAAQNLLNGYIVYTILFMMLLGIAFSLLNRYKNKAKDGVLLYCMIIPYLIISLVRNPMFYTVKEVIQFAIIPYIIYIIVKLGVAYEKDSI